MGAQDGADCGAQAADRVAGVGVKLLPAVHHFDDRPHIRVLLHSKYILSHENIRKC